MRSPLWAKLVLGAAVCVFILYGILSIAIMPERNPPRTISDQHAWNSGCGAARSRGCPLADFQDFGTGGLFIQGYDPLEDDKFSGLSSRCNRSENRTQENGCDDDIVLEACRNALGKSDADANYCKQQCCGA